MINVIKKNVVKNNIILSIICSWDALLVPSIIEDEHSSSRSNPLNVSTICSTSWLFFFSNSIQIYIMCTHVNTTTLYTSHINITINENNKFILKYHIKIPTLTSLS